MMDSDKEKESTLTPTAQEAIGDAARANVNAAVEVAKSAVGSFVGALTGERKKSSTTRLGARRKKAASKGAASKRGKTKRSAGGKRVCYCLKPQSYEKICDQAGKGEAA
jgi:hypothetical protein